MTTINPYLTFEGNCEEAFNFYKSIFGGEFLYLGRFDEMPDDYPVPESEKNKIMHVSLPIGNGSMLMGSDTSEGFGKKLIQGNNFSVSINSDSRVEADKLFKSLSENGEITMPIEDTFWGSYFGMVTDQFGIQWMISFSENQA